ncbi:MAG: DUF748 domain-containing protein [Candidatus Omnitrophota bacterium]
MKKWNRLFIIITILVICFSLFYAIFLLSAKAMLTAQIQQATGHKTTIGKFNIKPPLNIEISKLEIEGLARASYIYLSPSIPSLLFGKVAFNKVKIIEPEVTYQRTAPVIPIKDSRAVVSVVQPPVKAPPAAAPAVQSTGFPITIRNLKIYSGRLNFIDTTASIGIINFIIKDIRFYITNLPSSKPDAVSKFNLTGNISWNTGEPDGKISLQGWLNLSKKDMLADLKVEDIDAIVFYPYYSNWVDLEKARIDKAKLNFSSNIKGENNDIVAACHLELINIVRKVRAPEEPQQKAELLTDAVLGMFKTLDHGKVVLDFTLRMKMDRPEFGFGDIKSAFEGKLMQGRASAGLRPQDMLLLPSKWIQSGIKSGKDFSNAAVDGLFSLGSGMKKFFEDILNKQDSGESN